jgi:hypothetical protein
MEKNEKAHGGGGGSQRYREVYKARMPPRVTSGSLEHRLPPKGLFLDGLEWGEN